MVLGAGAAYNSHRVPTGHRREERAMDERVTTTALRAGRARRARRAVVVAGLAGLPFAACSSDPSFAEGDCVRIEQRILDSDLEKTSCDGAVGTFDPEARVYRVDSIIDGTGGGCPALRGFFPVEFVHEPDGVTYCLVQES